VRGETEGSKVKTMGITFGSTFDQAMIHATMGGPEPDER
jgi:hypothetical protein